MTCEKCRFFEIELEKLRVELAGTLLDLTAIRAAHRELHHNLAEMTHTAQELYAKVFPTKA